jgi:hypothetical protein
MILTYNTQPQAYRICAQWLGYRPDQLLMVGLPQVRPHGCTGRGYGSTFVHRPAEWAPPARQIQNPTQRTTSSRSISPTWLHSSAREARPYWKTRSINLCNKRPLGN